MFATAVYGLSYFIELSMPSLELAVLLLQFEYCGLTFIPFFWFLLVHSYGLQEKHEKREKALHLIFIIPIIFIILVWTNSYHNLIYKRIYLLEGVPLTILKAERGILFLPLNLTLNLLSLAATFMMVIKLIKSRGRFKGQFTLMTVAALFPLSAHFLLLKKMIPYNLDVIPIAFAVTGLLTFWGMIRIQLFDLIPIAQDMVLNALEDGIIVVDLKSRIIESNQAARNRFFPGEERGIGKTIKEINPLLAKRINEIPNHGEFMLKTANKSTCIFKLTCSEIKHRSFGVMGHLYILRDNTEMRSYVNNLKQLATFDTLTGIFNRRQFLDIAPVELNRAEKKGRPFSLVLFDLDHFKLVNDSFGHDAGDLVLQQTSRLIGEHMRSGSLYARYGGEEFVVLIPEADGEQAVAIIERLRLALEKAIVVYGEKAIEITASFGISTYQFNKDLTLDDYLKQADEAMYAAKEQGRNSIVHHDTMKTIPIALTD